MRVLKINERNGSEEPLGNSAITLPTRVKTD
jgi:hypothetical protein